MPSPRPRSYRAAAGAALAALLCVGQNAHAQPAPSAALDALAALSAAEGSVRVIVGLNVSSHPEGLLNAGDVLQQRANIRASQNAVVRQSLTGTSSHAHALFETIPFLAAEVDARALARLRASPLVSSIEEDQLAMTSLLQSTPLINAPTAWTNGSTGSGWAVAVLDTGVDKTHPFLAGKVVSEACYSTTSTLYDSQSLCPDGASSSNVSGSALPCATYCDHGTHVAGIAAGATRVADESHGVATDASVIAVQVFSLFPNYYGAGSGAVLSYTSDQIKGLERVYALRDTYNIASVNMSLAGSTAYSSACDSSYSATKAAIDTLRSVGIATIIAAGNNGWNTALSGPGCISTAISVGATCDASGGSYCATGVNGIASYSNIASFVSLVAPGSSIVSSVPGGGYASKNGTSMATPHVAGAWAVLKQAQPTVSVADALTQFQSYGLMVNDTRSGGSVTGLKRVELGFVGLFSLSVTKAGTAATSGTVTSSPSGINCGSDCTEQYSAGTLVTLTAAAAANSAFAGWSGACAGTASICTVSMSAAGAVTATFNAQNLPNVTVSSVSLSPGTVTGGSTSNATVTLNSPAPPGGITVALSSANTGVAAVPATVSVASGAKTAGVTVTTVPVAIDAPVALTATLNGVSKSTTLTVKAPVVSTLSLSPSSVTGGGSSTATVTLTGVAPAGGVVVALSSANPAAAAVPATASVAAGAKTASFTVTTLSVAADTSVALTATLNGVSKSVNLTVKLPLVSFVSLSPGTVTGGSTSNATVTLNSPAPPGGITVALSSANTGVAAVPATASVAAGATTISFTVTTVPVAIDAPVALTATLNGVSKSTTLTVKAPVVSAISLSPSSVTGGSSSTATVTLTGAAPTGGVVVALSSANTGVAAVPATVSVASGAKTAGVTVTTVPVAIDAPVALTATLNGVSKSTTLTVKAPVVSTLSLSPSSVTGGGSSTATVTLTGVAPAGGVVVALSSANPAAAAVPATASVAAGAKTASFTVTTLSVAADTSVALTATLNGVSKSVNLTVKLPLVSFVSLSPGTVTGGSTSNATVTLNSPAPPGGITVALSSANTGVAAVPATASVAAGATTISFTVTTVPVAIDAPVALTATLNGVSKSTTLTVKAPVVSAISLSPSSVTGGSSSTATVTLTGAAPTGGVVVALSSANTGVAAVPATVSVASGAKTAGVTVTTVPVAIDAPVALTATLNGVSKSTTLTVKAPVVSTLSLSPSSVTGGGSSTATVTLTGVAPAGGVVVALSSANPAAAAVPATASVAAGAKTASFTVTTTPVAADTVATLSAVLNGVSKTANLTVKK